MGNVTDISDAAQQPVFFRNTLVAASNFYVYDALYRLVHAEGREHAAQNNTQRDDKNFDYVIGIPFPNSPEALQRYFEDYEYDSVGNILGLRHTGGEAERWVRRYQYALDSNRLLATRLPGDAAKLPDYTAAPGYTAKYTYDVHGNMIAMPHLPIMEWDFKDQLQSTQAQVVNNGVGEKSYYVYDAGGQRVRKVTETQNGKLKDERIYLGGFEIYRNYNGNGQTVTLERETLHVMDDKQRVAMIETRTLPEGPDPAPRQLVRYQLGNHLGSAALELDDQARVITYEEYHPYGTTAYESARSNTQIAKRYRYTGKERDEETGFTYHGSRYYAPWLGRWTSADSISHLNLFAYCAGNPISLHDPDGKQERAREMYEAQVTGHETQAEVHKMFAAKDIFFKGNATWVNTDVGGHWHLQDWQIIARDTGMTLNLRADALGGKRPAQASPPKPAGPTAKERIQAKRQKDFEIAQSGMWDAAVDMLVSAISVGTHDPTTLDLLATAAKTVKTGEPAATGNQLRDLELKENYEGGGLVTNTVVLGLTLVPAGEMIQGARLAAGKAPALVGTGSLGGGEFVSFSEQWAAGAKTVTTEGVALEAEELSGLSVREAEHGRSVGQIQGRENRIEALTLHEFDPNQPAHIRGWLRNERRAVEFGNIPEVRTPRGYVQGHGPGTPARDGFDYYNSTLTFEEINDIQETLSRLFR
jgi:RHS repeat-associated protein